ncbi:MAG: tetratricopeptide repeat protein [Pseudomonadota bacterium]
MANNRRLLAATGLLLLAVMLPGQAATQEATEDAALQARFDRLFQELLQRPIDLDLMFDFAGTAIQLGDYEAAIATYERMLLMNPDLPRVKLELGALYYRLGSYEAARRYFEDAADDPDLPPQVAERIDGFLARINEDQARSLWFGSLTVAGRYQTNANAGPENIIVRAAGQPAEISDEFQAEDDFSFVVFGTARNLQRFDLGTDSAWLGLDNQALWQTDLEAYYSAEVEFQDLNVGLIAIETGPQFELMQSDPDAGDWFFRPYFLADFASLGQKPFFWTVGGGLSVTTTIDNWIGLNAWYELRYRDFNNTDENPDLDELTGIENLVGLDSNFLVTDRLRGRLGAFYDNDQARVSWQSNQELGLYGGIDLLYDAPFEWGSELWQASFTATGLFTGYSAPDPSVDPDVTRRDTEVRLNFINTVPVWEDISLMGQVEYLRNGSNLPNFRFNNLTFLLGATLDF